MPRRTVPSSLTPSAERRRAAEFASRQPEARATRDKRLRERVYAMPTDPYLRQMRAEADSRRQPRPDKQP